MGIMELVGVIKLLLNSAVSIKNLSAESRAPIKAYLLNLSQCLTQISQKRTAGENTAFECGELAVYLGNTPQDVRRLLGDDKSNKLIKRMQQVHESPSAPPIFRDNQRKLSIEQIESLAGELQGLANSI